MCTACDTTQGYLLSLSTNLCVSQAKVVILDPQVYLAKAASVDISVMFNKVSPPDDLSSLFAYMAISYWPNITLYKKGDNSTAETAPVAKKVYSKSQALVLDISFVSVPNNSPVETNASYGSPFLRLFYNNSWY